MKMLRNQIYVDYNATTPVCDEAVAAIKESLQAHWANPSSKHDLGLNARAAIEKARLEIAVMVDGKPEDITFTSGGTEANNMVIFGLCSEGALSQNPHVITSTVEHDSISLPLKHLTEAGKIDLTEIPINPSGLRPDDVISAINENTILITIMSANNETGLIMPIKEIGKRLIDLNKKRTAQHLPPIVFHSDGAQIIGKLSVSVQDLNLDCFTIVGHKFYGPRIGALWSRVRIPPLLFGGGQERNNRPGTENTPMIVGLGAAAKIMCSDEHKLRMIAMESAKNRLEILLRDRNIVDEVLDRCKQVIAGVGATCHTSKGGSPILLLHGILPEFALSAIRLSLGSIPVPDEKQLIAIVKDLEQAVLGLHHSEI